MLLKIIFSLTMSVMLFANSSYAATPIPVIFETDMGNDIDDVLALDMLYKYQDAGDVEIVLISNNKGNAMSAPFIHIMNAFYGYPNIPVATSTTDLLPLQKQKKPSYVEIVAQSGLFPARNDVRTFDSVEKYRQTLASQPDNSVVVISVGFSTNLRRLLESQPDKYSNLTGRELVARKVKHLSMMGGNFNEKKMKEFNIRFDFDAARIVFSDWPTDILLSPWEVGGNIFFKCSDLQKITYAKNHPIKIAYESYLTMPYDRECWDQTSVLAAIEAPQKWFGLSPRGTVSVDEVGRTEFTPSPDGRIKLLKVTPKQAEKAAKHISKIITRPSEKHAWQ